MGIGAAAMDTETKLALSATKVRSKSCMTEIATSPVQRTFLGVQAEMGKQQNL